MCTRQIEQNIFFSIKRTHIYQNEMQYDYGRSIMTTNNKNTHSAATNTHDHLRITLKITNF